MRTRNADKEQLVREQAIALIVSDGFEKFSMNRLARACQISVATLYIYYKDKEDLIVRIARQQGTHMAQALVRGFDPEAPFEEGLRVQWRNRYRYMMKHPQRQQFFEHLRQSGYYEPFLRTFLADFRETVTKFLDNAVGRGEIDAMPLEVYWSVAFAPLYSLLRFHFEGKSRGGKPYRLTEQDVWATFGYVVKALKR